MKFHKYQERECYGLLSVAHDQTKAVGILVSQVNRFKVFSELVTTAMATV